MARPRRDGTPPRETIRRKLTDLFVTSRKGGTRDELIWDVRQPGLALSVRTTGKKAWKVVYRFHGRPRWLHLGDTQVNRAGRRPAARPRRRRSTSSTARIRSPSSRRHGTGSFAELAADYVRLHARRHNKSWQGTEKLVARYLLPRWGKIKASAITRTDVRAVMARMSEAPITANQVLASASAIFSWAIRQEILTVNPCHGVDRNPTQDRERVLSDAEVTALWPRLEPALKLLLLTGQRPGEVAAMQAAHIEGGFWRMPGKPQGEWPGTKNGRDHRVALSEPALEQVKLHLSGAQQRPDVQPAPEEAGRRIRSGEGDAA